MPERLPSSSNGAAERCDVLHVAWKGFYGGIQIQLALLVRAMRSRGGPVHRVCFLEGEGPIADSLVSEGLAFRLGFHRGWGPAHLSQFGSTLRRARPSVIHFHSPVIGAALVATFTRDAACAFTQRGVRTELRNRVFYRAVRGRFALFAVPTPALRPSVERYGIDPARIVHLPNVLTVPLRTVSESHVTAPHRTVGVAARLSREKRLDVFIDVIAELRARGVDCQGVIVGEGPESDELRAHARGRLVDGHMQFVGAHADVTPWLDRFDVCLMTSESDVYPMAAIEAMARGIPLVAMPCAGGLPELAARGGLLLPDRSPATAADALIDLFESAEKRAELRARGAAVAAQHAVENVLPLHEEFYESLRRRQRRVR
jgi:glycosyltransferase involved in cell wall biosynthesis